MAAASRGRQAQQERRRRRHRCGDGGVGTGCGGGERRRSGEGDDHESARSASRRAPTESAARAPKKGRKNRAAQARRRRRDDAPVARRRRRKFQRALQAGGEFENGLSHLCCLQILHIHGSINSDEHVRQNIVSAEAINTCQAKGREAQGVTGQRSLGAARKAIQGDAGLKTLPLLIMKCAAHRA